MAATSTFFVRVSLLAAMLAVSSSAGAQTARESIADDADDSAPVATAPDVLPGTVLPATPIRDWEFDEARAAPRTEWQMGRSLGAPPRMPRLPQPRTRTPHSPAYKGVQRILAGAAMGTLGFVVGSVAGAMVGSAGCGCEDGALYGLAFGAPIGAAAGAALGVVLTR